MADIVGRAIYCLRTAVDHGPVSNRYAVVPHQLHLSVILLILRKANPGNVVLISEFAMEEDSPILAVELDVDEMAKDHKV